MNRSINRSIEQSLSSEKHTKTDSMTYKALDSDSVISRFGLRSASVGAEPMSTGHRAPL